MAGRTVVGMCITDDRCQRISCMTRRRTVRGYRHHIRCISRIAMVFTVMRTFEVGVIVITAAVTRCTVSGTARCVTVANPGLQLAVATRIRMTQSTAVTMRISYNVSCRGTVVAVRRTTRGSGYAGMIACIMGFKVGVVNAVTACTTAH